MSFYPNMLLGSGKAEGRKHRSFQIFEAIFLLLKIKSWLRVGSLLTEQFFVNPVSIFSKPIIRMPNQVSINALREVVKQSIRPYDCSRKSRTHRYSVCRPLKRQNRVSTRDSTRDTSRTARGRGRIEGWKMCVYGEGRRLSNCQIGSGSKYI